MGVVFLLLGVLGFVMQSPLLGLFGVNTLHNVVHLLTAVLLLWAGWGAEAPVGTVLKVLGVAYLLTAVVGWFGMLGSLMVGAGMDYDNVLHLVVGLALAYGGWSE